LRLRAILLVLIAILPLVALSIYSYIDARDRAFLEVRRDMLSLAKSLAQLQANLISETHQLLALLAELPRIKQGDIAGCQAIFAKVMQAGERYSALAAATPDGRIFASFPPRDQPLSISDRPYFRRLLETWDFVVGQSQTGRVSGKPAMSFAYPVLDESGQLKAVLVVGLDLNWLGEFLQRMDLPEHASLIFADQRGTILYGFPDPERYLGRSMPEAPVIKAMLDRGEGTEKTWGLEGSIVNFFGFAPVGPKALGLHLAVGMPRDAAIIPVRRDLERNLIWLGLVALISLIAAWFGVELFIIRRVNELLRVTDRLAAGDLAVRAGPSYQSGELGLLARSFDRMADALQERDARLKEAARELNRRVRELKERTGQLEEANKELESFSYSVSHDLRAPLRAIAGFSRILMEEYTSRLDDEGKRYLDVIQNDTRKMGKLIDDLLAISRLGRKVMKAADFDMERLAEAVFKELQGTEPGRNLKIRFKPMPPARGDRDMIRQVLVNLLSNAIKFTRTREIAEIEVSGWSAEAENVYCVRDNGVGFEMAYVEKLFGVFQRLHAADQFEGTGVGLAIVQRVIHRHGGRVWAESKEGEGAAFYFTLPKDELVTATG
jgi:signal transduction histidine kinase